MLFRICEKHNLHLQTEPTYGGRGYLENPDHIQENTELFDFELTEEEMERINGLDRGEKHDWY